MPKIIAGQTIALPIASLTLAAAAGAWLGFSSCGGYIWYSYLGYAVLALAALTAFLGSASLTKRVGLAILVVAAFLIARGVGFAAYLGAAVPASTCGS